VLTGELQGTLEWTGMVCVSPSWQGYPTVVFSRSVSDSNRRDAPFLLTIQTFPFPPPFTLLHPPPPLSLPQPIQYPRDSRRYQVHLFIYSSIYPSIHLSIYLSIHRSPGASRLWGCLSSPLFIKSPLPPFLRSFPFPPRFV